MPEYSHKIWRQYEKLLIEAVRKNHYSAVEKLLQYESVIISQDEFKPMHSTPLILAIQNKNVSIINLFRKYDYTLPEPHASNCDCNKCREDKFGQAKNRLLILKALSDPIWISLESKDPFLTMFKLSQLNKTFRQGSDSFYKEYDVMSEENEKFCVALLEEIRSQSEGSTLMRYNTIYKNNNCRDLSFINLAIEYNQKEVIAHSVTQHFLTTAVFDDIPRWETSGIIYKVFLVAIISILYPVTTLLNILCPSSCCSSIAGVAMKPFVKFVNCAASFITFLVLLTILGANDRDGIRDHKAPTGIEIAVFIWLIGFCFSECRQVYKNGIIDYVNSGWNWVDIGMNVLMLFSFITWAVMYYLGRTVDRDTYEKTIYVADGAFTVSIILSFFRIIYLCQITSYLGLLQLSLGAMIMVILQFAFIAFIVLLAFTVGMVYLYNSSKIGRIGEKEFRDSNVNTTVIYQIFEGSFSGFWSTLFTMIYVSLTMEGSENLEAFEDGTLVQLWANILLIIYFGISMIVVMNMLIAMMNNSYQRIADNITREHLCSRTKLWMEYVGDDQTRPVPFNLIPSIQSCIVCTRNVFSYFNSQTSNEIAVLKEEDKSRYKKLCHTLVKRYMRKLFGSSNYDQVPRVNEESDNDDPFLQRIDNHYEIWKQAFNGYFSEDVQETTTFTTADVDNAGYSDGDDESLDIYPSDNHSGKYLTDLTCSL